MSFLFFCGLVALSKLLGSRVGNLSLDLPSSDVIGGITGIGIFRCSGGGCSEDGAAFIGGGGGIDNDALIDGGGGGIMVESLPVAPMSFLF
eukprot:CAMPEP_0196220604 /NCGR_PEP_ID=MMETSP0912-20130531/41076_1 /TAXON_ID=49265 /ORGANISM="Thalassiosira rotula, Strain GSO102" /LENGTH=90 /DNA_ID=CAMNT_0041498871 /DNA_START=475 /DNA_END=747 /DNA_ORIENTATION=+